jgi:hypothetical protein
VANSQQPVRASKQHNV